MTIKWTLPLTAALICIVLTGCASQTVVLVPDPDGHTGSAAITTTGGSQTLQKPGDMTQVTGAAAAPAAVTAASAEFIAGKFADALAIEPLPAEKFILFFESGKTALAAESEPVAAEMLKAIKRRNPITISVSGHADASGSTQLNDRLANERAGLVRELLLNNGVAPEKMTLSSHGKGNPLIATPDGVAEPRNRRVEVIIR